MFPSADGTRLGEAHVRHMFYRILEKAQLRRIRFHDFRHMFATLLIVQGSGSPTCAISWGIDRFR